MSATASAAPAGRGLLVVSVMLATIMQVIDTTIANVALPSMQGSLSATQDQISWVLTSYIVASAIMTPPTGWLAARLGRKRLFLICIFGFTASSMACGLANGIIEMVAFRLAQGVFGAAIVPLSQATLLDAYPRERHGQAMAMWGVGIMVGPILGPTLGGWLTDVYSWRWVFFINLPVGVLTILGLLASVKETPRAQRPFDVQGFAYLSLAIGALQLMLDRGEQLDWFSSAEIMAEAGLTALGAYLFVVHSVTTDHPFIDLRMFRDRNFAAGVVFIFVIGIMLFATMALLPPFLQRLMGYPVLHTGWVLAPRGLGTMAAMILVGRVIGKIDPRALILCGLLFTAYSMHLMGGFNTDISDHDLVVTGILQGFGLGLVFVPLSTIAFATLSPALRVEAASVFSLARNIGSSIGISIVIAFLTRSTETNLAVLGERLTPFRDAVRQLPPAMDPSIPSGLGQLQALVSGQAATIGYLNDFRLMMYVTLAAVPILLLLRNPAKQRAAGRPAATAEAPPH